MYCWGFPYALLCHLGSPPVSTLVVALVVVVVHLGDHGDQVEVVVELEVVVLDRVELEIAIVFVVVLVAAA